MKKIIRPFVILASVIVLVTSCLGDDTWKYTYYSDTAITAFSLGTLNRYLTTTSSTGEDSIYTVEVTGSLYKFYIDQLSHEIYNPDSLPVGTDAEHVVCSVSSKNLGSIVIKNIDSDTLSYFSVEDSLDFTTPREFRVYSSDGTAYRKYMVSVNVHQEYADSFRWAQVGVYDEFTSLKGMKAISLGEHMFVFGTNGDETKVYSSEVSPTPSWSTLSTDITLDNEAYKNVISFDNLLWTMSNSELVYSSDGASWSKASTLSSEIDQLLGVGSKKFYALTTSGTIMSSSDMGLSWEQDGILGDVSKIPTQSVSLAYVPSKTNEDTERIIIAGDRSEDIYPEDSVSMVWNKLEEYSSPEEQHSWFLCNEQNGFELPRLKNICMLKYGEVLLAMGGHALGTSSAQAFSTLYASEDSGLTWHSQTDYTLPEDFSNEDSDVFAFAMDENNYIWIICGGNGQIWRGRINMMGWAEDQTSFVK